MCTKYPGISIVHEVTNVSNHGCINPPGEATRCPTQRNNIWVDLVYENLLTMVTWRAHSRAARLNPGTLTWLLSPFENTCNNRVLQPSVVHGSGDPRRFHLGTVPLVRLWTFPRFATALFSLKYVCMCTMYLLESRDHEHVLR